jgi:hypothetical protein
MPSGLNNKLNKLRYTVRKEEQLETVNKFIKYYSNGRFTIRIQHKRNIICDLTSCAEQDAFDILSYRSSKYKTLMVLGKQTDKSISEILLGKHFVKNSKVFRYKVYAILDEPDDIDGKVYEAVRSYSLRKKLTTFVMNNVVEELHTIKRGLEIALRRIEPNEDEAKIRKIREEANIENRKGRKTVVERSINIKDQFEKIVGIHTYTTPRRKEPSTVDQKSKAENWYERYLRKREEERLRKPQEYFSFNLALSQRKGTVINKPVLEPEPTLKRRKAAFKKRIIPLNVKEPIKKAKKAKEVIPLTSLNFMSLLDEDPFTYCG